MIFFLGVTTEVTTEGPETTTPEIVKPKITTESGQLENNIPPYSSVSPKNRLYQIDRYMPGLAALPIFISFASFPDMTTEVTTEGATTKAPEITTFGELM